MKIATVGTFDGVHRGHEAVLHTLMDEAERHELSPLVITFSNHPLDIVAPNRAPKAMLSPEEKLEAIEKKGAEVKMLTFDKALCSLTAAQWLAQLKRDYDVQALVLGYDNTFGSDGRHLSREDYHELARRVGIRIIDAPVLQGCSSSAARRAVAGGDIDLANKILGRPFCLKGRVIKGMALGRTLGFPTANLDIAPERIIPAGGVYAVDVEGLEEGKLYRGVVNIGSRPTVEGRDAGVECHIIGWAGDIYGREINLRFLQRLRDERRFETLDQLKTAIAGDVAQAATMSNNRRPLR